MGQKATWQERVDAAIAEGKLWRAKEILQGNLRTRGYDLELYERFGQVLLEMGDTLEAGKYLFLSGVRCPEYDEAIELYLSRYARKAPRNLVGTFPRSARRANVADYPEAVRRVLRDLDTGAPGTAARPGGIPRRGSAHGTVVPYTCCAAVVVAFVVVLVCAGAGFPVVWEWLFGH